MNENKIREKIDGQKDIKYKKTKNNLKQDVYFILTEYKNKLSEYEQIKEKISEAKTIFRKTLSEYNIKKKSIKEKENEIEDIFLKVIKIRKNLILTINKTINKKFYNHLEEILEDKEQEKLLIQYFNFSYNIYNICKFYNFQSCNNNSNNDFENIFLQNYENEDMKNLLKVVKNDNEIKILILYLIEKIQSLYKEEKNIFYKIKDTYLDMLNKIKKTEKQYPVDILYDFINSVFIIIEYENQIDEMKIILNKLIEEKNTKFVQIKSLETLIKKYNSNKKIISNQIKTINIFICKLKEQKEENSKESDGEFIKEVEIIKKLINNNNATNINVNSITSSKLTNFNFNDKSSIKNQLIEIKKNIINFDLINDNKKIKNQKKNLNEKIDDNFKKRNNTFFKLIKNININIEDNKIRNKSNNLQKNSKEKSFKSPNDIIMNNNNLILTKQKVYHSNYNYKNLKNNLKNIKEPKMFNKIKKTKIVGRCRNNKNDNHLMFPAQSQIINKNKVGKKAFKSENEKGIFKTLNNFNEKINIINSTYNNSNNKTQVITKNNHFIRKLNHKKNKALNPKGKSREKVLTNKRPLLNSNSENLENKITNTNTVNITELKEQVKKLEQNNSLEIVGLNKDNIKNEENNEINEIKDSICDEVGSKKDDKENGLVRTSTNNYINKLGTKKNIIWSDHLYNNKMMNNCNNKPLNVEKPTDSFACCASCT